MNVNTTKIEIGYIALTTIKLFPPQTTEIGEVTVSNCTQFSDTQCASIHSKYYNYLAILSVFQTLYDMYAL